MLHLRALLYYASRGFAFMIPPFTQEMAQGRRRVDKKTFVEAAVFETMYKDKKYAELFGPEVQVATEEGDPEVAGHWVKGDFFSFLPGHHLYGRCVWLRRGLLHSLMGHQLQ